MNNITPIVIGSIVGIVIGLLLAHIVPLKLDQPNHFYWTAQEDTGLNVEMCVRCNSYPLGSAERLECIGRSGYASDSPVIE